MATDELGLFPKGHGFPGSGWDAIPNRSGSAPPSMEGSFLAIGNLILQQNSSPDASLVGLNSAMENCESEEQLRSDPAYIAYYCSNVNLNPRLPPPLISWENRRLLRHIGSLGNKRALTSLDDNGSSFLHLTGGALSTHLEESEDDQSPQQPSSSGGVDKTSELWLVQDDTSLAGQHKSLVDLIQEDFPRTPSPLYNQSQSLSHGLAEEAVSCDADSSSMNDSHVSSVTSTTSALGADDKEMMLIADPAAAIVSGSSSLVSENENIPVLDEQNIGGANMSDTVIIESKMNNLNISSRPNSERPKNRKQESYQNNLVQQQSNSAPVESVKSQTSSVNCTYSGTEQSFQSPSKFSSQVRSVMQSAGFTPPFYRTAATYMTSGNPFYPNLQAPGLISPQYGVGGYALNSNDHLTYAAYPPQSAVPLVFDGTAGPSFNAQMPGGSIAPGANTQHLNKFYGQPGFALQPDLAVSHYMQYYQQPFGEAYGISGQINPLQSGGGVIGHISPLQSGGGVIGNQVGIGASHRWSDIATSSDNQQFQHQRAGGLGDLNSRRGGMMSPNHYRAPLNMGVMMQYPTSPCTNPFFPGLPMGGASLGVGRNEMRFPPVPNAGINSGRQGQGAFENYTDPKISNFLEELKSGKGRRFELSDITGHIVEFSADQHGSRFIQQKLENCSAEDKASVFKEVLPHASKLMTDVFGNYVIQKFLDYGSPEQRKELANQLRSQILPLSLQMYGCRVIQKALEVIELEQKAQLVRELDGHVMRCVRDQNGNHVIQKCIESVPTEKIGFIISAFRGQVATLSMHPYGCRVIQRVLEHCTDELQCQFIVDEILESVGALAQDQYGNYVTQHVLERGKPHERRQIIGKLSGQIVQLSQHKFASNVVEKCLEHGGTAERDQLIEEIVGQNEGNDNLLTMVKDQYANYVVQKALEICSDDQRVLLLSRVRFHVHALKKYTYGKHIVARFEQLFGEDDQTSGS